MSGHLQLSLALLSISLSTSYLLSNSSIVDDLSPVELPPFNLSLPWFNSAQEEHEPTDMPSDAELAADALHDEASLRFHQFKMDDAITIGMNLRKRFRASIRHGKGKGCVISIQTMQGATMFACSVGEGSDVSLDSWWRIEAMIKVVRRTGHSTLYIERGIQAVGKSPEELGLPFPEYRIDGGAFPIWLKSSPITPIGVIAIYSGSSLEDHHIIVATLKSYFNKVSQGEHSGSIAGHYNGKEQEY
ncbi:hypothetical protein FRC03_011755 [Tulasnella sp. 419]|nr:hypothetical protein FRC02_002205 [Tulasnella sp. 418]KAG8966525.1 hypothetical protein FRC03_011755 [Tulasnella sp. 419]